MLQDNPLLAQLKQQLHSQTPRAEGVVKATEKGFGFLEVDAQKSYFIPPPQMKKVMHGDRIIAVIHSEKERESAEPEELVEVATDEEDEEMNEDVVTEKEQLSELKRFYVEKFEGNVDRKSVV